MASNLTLFMLPIFLLLTCSTPRVSSNEDEIKIIVNYASSLAFAIALPVVASLLAPPTPPPSIDPIIKSNKDCMPLCENRCQLHSRKRVCMRACGTCCKWCKCIPPGTSGNREKCGKCYTGMITHGNRYKCP